MPQQTRMSGEVLVLLTFYDVFNKYYAVMLRYFPITKEESIFAEVFFHFFSYCSYASSSRPTASNPVVQYFPVLLSGEHWLYLFWLLTLFNRWGIWS